QRSQVQSVDLSIILKAFVRKGQHKLNAEFQSLPKTFDVLDRSFDDLDQYLLCQQKVIDEDIRTTITNRRSKTIGQFKLDMMAIHISTAGATARGHAKIAKEEKEKLLLLLSSENAGAAANVISAIQARQENIIKRHRRSTATKTITASHIDDMNSLLPSSAIIEVATPFTNKQILFLARGSKYVPKCQSQFGSGGAIEDIIEREYLRMSPIIRDCLTANCVSASDERAKIFFISLKNLLTQLYTAKLPCQLFRRAQQEYLLTKTIKHQLYSTFNHIVLRRTDKSKVFHLGSKNDYQQKAIMNMRKTCAYEEVINEKCPLADNISPIGTPLRPIISSMNGPTTGASHFLDRLLRPVFDRVAKQTTFVNGIDLVCQWENYRDSGHLLASTQFVTFDVSDLYTMIPRNGALEALGRFLVQNSTRGKINNISVDTILKLARLVLDTNYFVYDNKYYRQIKGGAMGSPFTMTLANVYMLEWEQPLIKSQRSQGKLYGIYIDDVFMTSNMSLDAIHAELDWMNKRDEKNIQITYSVGFQVEFLDVHVENYHGSLITSVFHKPAAEPYVLPYSSDHPRHIHTNIPYQALLRAAQLCSYVYAFDKERLEIEIILLLNGYPPQFIKRHFNRFFRLNRAMQVLTELDPKQYEELHQKLLYLSTRREKMYEKRTSDKNNNEQVYKNDNANKLTKKEWNKKILILPHTFESGPLMEFKREFRKLWTKSYTYKGSLMKDVRLVMTTLCNPSLNDLLVYKKPSRSLLTKMEPLISASSLS
ncbi:unnamed protein product, partial [Rotaria sordida]